MTYANRTAVPIERSRAEVERLLQKHGADQFMNGWDDQRAVIGFRMYGRYIRITLPLPQQTGRGASERTAQLQRSRWRALVLVLKAKLEAIDAGIVTFEDEFLAHVVLPDGATVGGHLRPRIAEAYKSGKLPALLPPSATGAP